MLPVGDPPTPKYLCAEGEAAAKREFELPQPAHRAAASLAAGAGVLLLIGCAIIAATGHAGPGSNEIWIGLVLGTLYGQTSVSACWAALGPGRLLLRLPFALVWLLALLFSVGMSRLGPGEPLGLLVVVGVPALAQWLVLQLPLWALVLVFGLRLQHRDERVPRGAKPKQFGIRQLMIFTLLVGVLLGGGRALVMNAVFQADFGREGPIFAIIVATMTLPLAVSAFMGQRAKLGVLLMLLAAAVATYFELPLLEMLGRSGPNMMHLIWINFITLGWVLAFVALARACGYRYPTSAAEGESPFGDFALKTDPLSGRSE